MLPRQNRLKKNTDFERVFKKGKTAKEGFLLLKFTKNNLQVSRFGFVISKNLSKKATLRNKIKRRLRAIIRNELLQIKPGFDGIWVALKGVETKKFKEIETTVKKILQKAKLII